MSNILERELYDLSPFKAAEDFDSKLVDLINSTQKLGVTNLVLYGILQFQSVQIINEALSRANNFSPLEGVKI